MDMNRFWREKRHSAQNLFSFEVRGPSACILKIKGGLKKMPDFPQKVILEPPLLPFFPSKKHHPMRNENLLIVTDFGDPNASIEWIVLQKKL